MNKRQTIWLGAVCLMLMSPGAQSKNEGSLSACPSGVRKELKRARERYEDYFAHQQKKKRLKQKREAGIKALKKRRKRLEQAREKARKNYIKKTDKLNPEQRRKRLKQAYLEKKKQEEKRREKLRERYVQCRNALQQALESQKQIPERKEVGLE